MAQSKVLILTIVTIIILGNCCFKINNKLKMSNFNNSMIMYNSLDTILLSEKEFEIIKDSSGYELVILELKKLNIISNLVDPKIDFFLGNKSIKARGINIFSSQTPNDVDYFFPLHENKIIYFFKNKNNHSISITKIIRE